MTIRCLIVGGFEPSGHDRTAEALLEGAQRRGILAEMLQWRDRVSLSDHPIFVSHRYAAAHGAPQVAGLLDESWIGEALAADLGGFLPLDFDVYLSVHPWSSIICAHALVATDHCQASLIDYHSEFSQFPVITHPRINCYLGGGGIRSLEPSIRRRCLRIGVAVPERFYRPAKSAPERDKSLVVSAGSDGWAIEALASPARALVKHVTPQRVILLAPTVWAAEAWSRTGIRAEIITGLTDISTLLSESRWYLSKAGGIAIAEGLAAGCIGYTASSGIFWEDEALAALALAGVVSVITSDGRFTAADAQAAKTERLLTFGAANAAWDVVEGATLCGTHLGVEGKILDILLSQIGPNATAILPTTTALFQRRLMEWRAQIKVEEQLS